MSISLHSNLNKVLDRRSIEVLADEEIAKRIVPGAPSVLYMGMRYYYTNKKAGLDYGHYHMYGSLLDGQYSVHYFDFDRLYRRYGKHRMSELLREFVFTYGPKYILYAHWKDIIEESVWKEIREESGSLSIIWLSDDHWRFEETKGLCDLFDVIVTTDREGYLKRTRSGMSNVVLSQWGCNTNIYRDYGLPKRYDVTFVGQMYGEREEFCNKLKEKGIDIHMFGRGWPSSGKISQSDLIKILNQSWISLDLTRSSGNATYQIKGRPFEVTACGSLMLTRSNPHLADYFKIGEEIVTYDDVDDAANKIKALLADKERLRKIAENGRERTLRDHTYQARFGDIFREADRIGKRLERSV